MKDFLLEEEIERQRRTPPSDRAWQAMEQMRAGIRLQRVALRQRHPRESEEDIEARLRRWLAQDD